MEKIVIVVMMISTLALSICQFIRNNRLKGLSELKTRMSPSFLILTCLGLACDMLVSEGRPESQRIIMDMMPSVFALWILLSSVTDAENFKWMLKLLLAAYACLPVYYLCCMSGLFRLLSVSSAVWSASVIIGLMALHMTAGLVRRLFDIKAVMKSGTTWGIVCLMIDMVYLMLVFAAASLLLAGLSRIALPLMGGILIGMGLRIYMDSGFILFRKHERIIAESMKIGILVPAGDSSHLEEVYKDLYDRIIDYFEREKPYLNGELTINEVVRELYSNKLYISRAISQFTGRNFCQFVNYYRVIHSIDCFRENPDLKVHELGSMSGFNTIVSYNMAFRLFMGENPSEWCRKEKSRLLKAKK